MQQTLLLDIRMFIGTSTQPLREHFKYPSRYRVKSLQDPSELKYAALRGAPGAPQTLLLLYSREALRCADLSKSSSMSRNPRKPVAPDELEGERAANSVRHQRDRRGDDIRRPAHLRPNRTWVHRSSFAANESAAAAVQEGEELRPSSFSASESGPLVRSHSCVCWR